MRVCVLIENHYQGGMANIASTLIHGLSDDSIDLTLLTNSNNPMLGHFDPTVSKVRKFKFVSSSTWFSGTAHWIRFSGANVGLNVARKLLKPFILLNQLIWLSKYFRDEKFDALLNINGGYPGSITTRAASLSWAITGGSGRQVMAIHNFAAPSRFGFRNIDRLFDRAVFSAVDKVVTVSESCLESFSKRNILTGHANASVIPNAVEQVIRQNGIRESKRKALGVSSDQTLILMLGSYEIRKGHDFLIDSFANLFQKLSSARLVCAGDDPSAMRNILRKKVDRLGLTDCVTFLPFQSDVSDLLEACDIVVIPSQSFESFCMVALDAFQFGKPIVATNVGALPETAPDGLGTILCSPDDVGSFTDAIYRLASDPRMYNEYARLSGLQIERFSVNKMVYDYKTCLNGSR